MDYQALVSDHLGQGLYQELGLDKKVSLVWALVQEVYPVVGLDLVSVPGSAFGHGGKSEFLKISNTLAEKNNDTVVFCYIAKSNLFKIDEHCNIDTG